MWKHFTITVWFVAVVIFKISNTKPTIENHTDKFILDFIEAQQCTPNIVALTGWTKEDKVNLWRTLSNKSLSVTFWRQKHFIEKLRLVTHPTTFLIDIQSDKCKLILKKVAPLMDRFDFRYFQEPHQWVIFANYVSVPSHLYFGLNSKIFVVNNIHNHFKVDGIFKYSETDETFTKNDVALWTPGKRFLYFNKLDYAVNRTSLARRKLKVLYFNSNFSEPDGPLGLSFYEKRRKVVSEFFYEKICSYLNATFEPVIQNELSIAPNQFSPLLNGEADLFGTAIRASEKHLEHFRYIAKGYLNLVFFIYKAPGLASVENVYAKPLFTHSSIWLLFILILAPIVMYVMVIILRSVSPDTEIDLWFLDIVMLQCSTILQKNSNFELKSWSGRIATSFLYLTLMIVTVFYTANIVVYLQDTTGPIEKFEDLYQSAITLGASNDLYETYMTPNEKLSDEAFRQKIFKEKIQNKKFFFSLEEGIKKVRTEFFAFETNLEAVYHIIQTTFDEFEKCSLRTTQGFYSTVTRYLMIPKNSSLTDLIKISNLKIFENALHKRPLVMWDLRKPKCDNSGMRNFSGMGLTETKYMFLVFIFGTLFSVGLFILEKIVYNYRNSLKYYQHYNSCVKFYGGTEIQVYTE